MTDYGAEDYNTSLFSRVEKNTDEFEFLCRTFIFLHYRAVHNVILENIKLDNQFPTGKYA